MVGRKHVTHYTSHSTRIVLFVLVFLHVASVAQAGEWSGYAGVETRGFVESPADPRQREASLSFVAQPEYYHSWDDGYQSIRFVPFARIDVQDKERTHADIRELYWEKSEERWELRVGVRKVFWGVTESQHIVDVINQVDLVENPDGEDRLGQPMVNLALIQDWGTIDLFILPGFRERTFPGNTGRLRTIPPVDANQARYESGVGQGRVDLAARWSHSVGGLDVGVAHFSGTSRDPRLLLGTDQFGSPAWIPFYEVIEQTSADLQYTQGSWLWKLEWLTRDGQRDRYTAMTSGVEYTTYGVCESPVDVGWLAEYLYDDRGEASPSPFEDDVFVGIRVTMNDAQSTEMLAGVIVDCEDQATVVSIEASRRVGAQWKVSVEVRVYSGLSSDNPIAGLKEDDYILVEVARYF